MLRLTTLGAVDLRDRRGRPVREVLAQPKRVALLVYLALEGRRARVPRDRLLALLWPESDEARARNALSQSLHHLRQALGGEVIVSHGATALGVEAAQLWCDASEFEAVLERGEMELALDLYRGEFCPALAISASPDLEHWIERERVRLGRLALDAARNLARRMLERGDRDGAARLARRALGMRPDDEGEVRELLALLENAGDAAGALRGFDDYARRLRAELEQEPASATLRLAEAIRARRETAAGAALAAAQQAAAAPAREAAAAPPGAGEPVTAPAVRRRPGRAGLAVLLLLAVVGGGLALARRGRNAAPAMKTVAVFPFTIRGGAPPAYLREGLADLISAKLNGAPGFRAVDPRSVIAAVAEQSPDGEPGPGSGARLARRLGADWYVSGEVLEVAGRLQVNGALYDHALGPRPVASAAVTGDTATLFQLVDDLTGQMMAGLLAGRDTALTRLGALTTHSLPALQAFLRGEQALRAGRDAQAAAAFREAVELDTGFALAQYRLAVMATWVRVPSPMPYNLEWAAAAEHTSRRLAPLARDLLAAYLAYKELRADDAERMYRGVTGGHPDNVEAWLMLGETLFHYGPWRGRSSMEAWTPFRRALALEPSNPHALVHLARLAAVEGRLGTLDSLATGFLARYPDADRALEMRVLRAAARNEVGTLDSLGAAAREADDVIAASLLYAVIHWSQNLGAAPALAQRWVESEGDTTLYMRAGRSALSDVALSGGRWGRAAAESLFAGAVDERWLLESEALVASDPFFLLPRERLVALRDSITARREYVALPAPTFEPDPSLGPLARAFLLGLLEARLGDLDAAGRHLAEIERTREARLAVVTAGMRVSLRAAIARSRGDLRGALSELDRFAFGSVSREVRHFAHWGIRERFQRAELLHALGRDEEALRLYDSFLNWSDLPWAAAAHLRRGEIYESRGNSGQAIFHYGRFVSMWRHCDPEYRPLVDRAEQALARLRGEAARR